MTTTLYDNCKAGDDRVIQEENADGDLFLTTNAETQERVRPSQFMGWPMQDDSAAAEVWIDELSVMFGGSRDLAVRFAKKAGALIAD